MVSSDEPQHSTPPTERLASAWEVKRRPRPSGSSWLLDPDLDLGTLRYRELLQRDRLIALSKRPVDAPILSRKAFDNAQRRAVCIMAAADHTLSNQDLADLFGTNRTTITRTLQQSKTWLQSNPSGSTKVARKRRPANGRLELHVQSWACECMEDGVLITDDMIKARAMAFANEYRLLDLPKPFKFACSPKWIRNFKSRLGIVDGIITNFEKMSSRSREGTIRLSTREIRNEPSEGFQGASSPQYLAELTPGSGSASSSASDSSPSLMPFGSAMFASYTDALPPAAPLGFASRTFEGTTNSLPSWAQDASPLPTMEHAPPDLSYQTPSPQSSLELYTPDWLPIPELAAQAQAGQYEKYDGMHDAPASDLQAGSGIPSDMSTSFLLTHGYTSGPPTLPDMQVSFPPQVADGSAAAPVPLSPLDYIVGMPPTDGVSPDAAPFVSPVPDAAVPSSLIWPSHTNASPTLASSVDVSPPSMSPTDALGILVPQPARVPQEDIDRLAAEMMHWPIEALLDDVSAPMSQSHAACPCGEMSFGAPMLSNC